MKKHSVLIIASVISGSLMASDRQLLSANIGLQIQNNSDPLVSTPIAFGFKNTNNSGLTLSVGDSDSDLTLSVVGNAEFSYRFGGQTSDSFAVFANISTPKFGGDPRSNFGIEFLNSEQHSIDIGISSLVFDSNGEGFLGYGANYYFTQNDWLVSGHFNQTLGKAFNPEQDGLWKVDMFVNKSISLPSLGNSELALGGGLRFLPKDYSEVHYEIENKSLVTGHLSADWLYPISEHWLLTTSLTQGIVPKGLANSTKVDEDNLTQLATGIRYVF